MAPRTRKATPATTPADNAPATTPADNAPVTVDINPERAAIVERIKYNAGEITRNSGLLLADLLTLSAGIRSADYESVVGGEIGGLRLGRVLTRSDRATLVATLRNKAREGGSINVKVIVSVFSIGQGDVTALEREGNGETADATDGNKPNGGKSAEDMIDRLTADMGKLLAKDDAKSARVQLKLRLLLETIREALPESVDNNNRGGKG